MNVIAAPGIKCPKEENPRDYIDDTTPQEVPDTAYYRRLVEDGSLVVSPSPQPSPTGGEGGNPKKKGGNA